MELIKTLGLDDLGRTIVRSAHSDGATAVVLYTAYDYDAGTAQVIHTENLTGDAAALVAKKYAEYSDYQKIRDGFTSTLRIGTYHLDPNLQNLPKPVSGPNLVVFDDKYKTGHSDQKRHHKRKPQPNRGPIGRKEWT